MNQQRQRSLTLRLAVTFLGVAAILVLAILQMDLRGYDDIVRINQYVLYQNDDEICVDDNFHENDTDYTIACASQYLLKSGFVEYDVVTALAEGVVTIDDLRPHVTITAIE